MPNLHKEHEYIQDFIKARGLYLIHVLYSKLFSNSLRGDVKAGVYASTKW